MTTRRTFDTDVNTLMHSIGLLVRRMRSAVASHDLSMTESAVLGRLEREGPATTADLARAEGMKPQSMGTTVAALDEMGLVERKPHPTDGRQLLVSLTAKGSSVRRSVKSAKETWLAQAIAQLDRSEQQTLFAAGEIIRRMVEK